MEKETFKLHVSANSYVKLRKVYIHFLKIKIKNISSAKSESGTF